MSYPAPALHAARRRTFWQRPVTARVVVLIVVVASVAVTAAVPARLAVTADIRPTTMLAIDMLSSFSALLVAFLAFGRFAQNRLYRYVLLATAMATLGIGSLVLAVVPSLVGDLAAGAFGPRAVTGLLAALLFALATLVSPARVTSRHPIPLVVAAVVLLSSAATLLARALPDLGSYVGSAEMLGASKSLVPAACQVAATLLFALAAIGAVRRADRDGDALMGWLSAAAVLAAFSRLDFALARAEDSPWVVTGIAFRLGFYLLLTGGAVQEIRWYWQRVTVAAVLEERRRIARELHDGLAQELAFVAAQSRIVVARPPSTARAALVAAAAQRALDEARRAIAALTRSLDEPLDVALAQEVEEVANRFGSQIDLDLEAGIEVSSERREALLRIAREAVTNAARHAEASVLSVRLSNHQGVLLRVVDDGHGFDPTAESVSMGHLGITSMRERAEAVGGTFSLRSRAGDGTIVEVRLP